MEKILTNKMYEIPSALQMRLDEYMAPETTDERRLELEAELELLDLTFKEKMDSYATLQASYNRKADELKYEIARLKDWQKRCELAAESLEERMENAATAVGVKNFETEHYRFSWRKSESVVIDEGAVIPRKYSRHVPESWTPDKAAIKAAIKSGTPVEGARIVTKQNLQIK